MPFILNANRRKVEAAGPHPQLQGCLMWVYAKENETQDLINGYTLEKDAATSVGTLDGRYCWQNPDTANNTGRVRVLSGALSHGKRMLWTWWAYNFSITGRYFAYINNGNESYNYSANNWQTRFRQVNDIQRENRINGFIITGAWYHYAAASNGPPGDNTNDSYVYRNGVLQTFDISAKLYTLKTGTNMAFLNYNGTAQQTQGIRGAMDDMRVYDLDLMDQVTYPTLTSLVQDIYNNPDAGLP